MTGDPRFTVDAAIRAAINRYRYAGNYSAGRLKRYATVDERVTNSVRLWEAAVANAAPPPGPLDVTELGPGMERGGAHLYHDDSEWT